MEYNVNIMGRLSEDVFVKFEKIIQKIEFENGPEWHNDGDKFRLFASSMESAEFDRMLDNIVEFLDKNKLNEQFSYYHTDDNQSEVYLGIFRRRKDDGHNNFRHRCRTEVYERHRKFIRYGEFEGHVCDQHGLRQGVWNRADFCSHGNHGGQGRYFDIEGG